MKWNRLRNAEAPWGDYGAILVSGMSAGRDEFGRLRIMRTGPWVPPITIVSGVHAVATDTFRELLLTSGLHGFAFQPVDKVRVVRLDWRRWDLTAAEPARYPAGGEPESYIEKRKHEPELAVIRPNHEPGSPDAMSTELGLRNVMFEVDDLQGDLDRLAADGYGLVGGIGLYEDIWRMAYVRGPEGIIVALAQRIG